MWSSRNSTSNKIERLPISFFLVNHLLHHLFRFSSPPRLETNMFSLTLSSSLSRQKAMAVTKSSLMIPMKFRVQIFSDSNIPWGKWFLTKMSNTHDKIGPNFQNFLWMLPRVYKRVRRTMINHFSLSFQSLQSITIKHFLSGSWF